MISVCRNTLRSLGVIRRRYIIKTDWVSDKLNSLYDCANLKVWKQLLGTEYEHALQILVEAEARFPGAYSEWLALQDSFNDITIRQFFTFLNSKGLPGHSRLISARGLVNYGTLIAVGSPFDRHYATEADYFRQIHNRRNKLPGSHPYDEKGGSKNRWLTKQERDRIAVAVKNSLESIATVVRTNSV